GHDIASPGRYDDRKAPTSCELSITEHPMRSIARTLLGTAALTALAVGCSSWDNRTTAPAPGQVKAGAVAVGQPAPEITGEDIDGIPMKLSDFRGKVVMLDFWGNW